MGTVRRILWAGATAALFCQPGCVLIWANGGNVAFQAFRVSDDYPLPNSADPMSSFNSPAPRADQLKPAPDTVLIRFYTDMLQDRFQILGAHLLKRQGRRLRYPLRPFLIWFTSEASGGGIGVKQLGVIAFAKDCWPVVYVQIDGQEWLSQRGGFVHKVDSTPDLMCPRLCLALGHVVLVPRHRPFAPIAICAASDHISVGADTTAVFRLLEHAGRRIMKAVAHSRELTDEHRLMVFTQMLDLAERLARPPGECTPLLSDLKDRLAQRIEALRQKRGGGVGCSGSS